MGPAGVEVDFDDLGRRLPPAHATRREPVTRRRAGDWPAHDHVDRIKGTVCMTPVTTMVAKELRSYFVSPVVYVVGAVFLFIVGLLSYLYIVFAGAQAIQLMQMQGGMAQLNLNDLVFRNLFSSIRFVLLLTLPILTMRLFAEERKLRTFEFLMTSPIGIHEIVAGKFMSVFLVFLGLALLGALFLSVGVLASALTENQIVAAFLSFGILLLFWLLAGLGSLMGVTALGQAVSYLSFMEHFDHFVRGLIDTKDLVYFLSGLVLMLFLTHRVVEAVRWK